MNLFAVGKIVGCFGIKGFLKLQPLTQHPERFQKLRTVHLGRSAAETVLYTIVEIETGGKHMLVRFVNVSDRTSAEALTGNFVFVGEDQLQSPDSGTYFIHDLINCEVVSTTGRNVGVIKEIFQLPGHDLWEVHDGGRSFMIPAVKEFIRNVDLKKRTVTIELIDGLIEGGAAAE